ncbi:MAG: hypothetical protein ACI311_01935, partial [Bacilli bacterium]
MSKDCWVEKIDTNGKGVCIHHAEYISEAVKFVKDYDLKENEKLIIWQNCVGKVYYRTFDNQGI